jgi:hypothetical protein
MIRAKDGQLNTMLGGIPAFRKVDEKTGKSTTNLEGLEGISVKAEVQPDGSYKYNVYLDSKDDIPDHSYTNQIDMLKGLKGFQLQNEAEIEQAAQGMSQMRPDKVSSLKQSKSLDEYKAAIKQQETGGRNIPNLTGSGAMGLYQFMPATVRGLVDKGLLNWDENKIANFPNDIALQEEAMSALLTDQMATIRNMGYNIDPNNLTNEAKALLASMHYGGPKAAQAIINKSPWIFEKRPQRDPKTGQLSIDRNGNPILYPSVADYVAQSLGIKVKDLKFS